MKPIRLSWRLRHIFWNNVLTNNIILAQAIGICPIVAGAYRLQYGVVLAICTALVLVSTSLLMSLLGERLPQWLRPPVYTVVGSLVLWGSAWLLDTYLSSEIYAALYLYLPLMAVNALNYRVGGFATGNKPAIAVMDAVGTSIGFGAVICIVAAAREMLSFGTLWNMPLWGHPVLAQMDKPFAAFFMLAALATLLQGIRMLRRGKEGGDEHA